MTGLPTGIAATAAPVSAGGRVTTAAGRAISNAKITITDSTGQSQTAMTKGAGYYRFLNLLSGQTYVFSVESKRYTFSNQTQIINLHEERLDVNFVADN